MKIPGFDKAYGHALDWGLRGEGREIFYDAVDAHTEGARMTSGMTGDDFAKSVGTFGTMAVTVAADDFLTCPFVAGAESVIGNYLRRRGWKERAPGRAALRSLEQSVMSLYELVAESPAGALTVRDLIRGGEPVEAHAMLAMAIPAPGYRLGLRVFQWKGQYHIARGVLPFSQAGAAVVLDAVSRLRGDSGDVGRTLANTWWLRDNAALFTNIWLIDVESDEWATEYLLRDGPGGQGLEPLRPARPEPEPVPAVA